MKVVIVIPTYNEKENIGKCLTALLTEFPLIPHETHVLVVDGNSPDGTSDVVREFSKNNPNIHLLLEEKKGGLGAAYASGMKNAMAEMGADVVIEMDGDLQHNPKDVKRLVEAINSGADVAIGSRYISGGSVPADWAFQRKLFSYFGNIYGRVMLGMLNCHDVTTGFRATRVKEFLDRVDLDNLLSKRFAYKLDLFYRLNSLGAKITEVPIEFMSRGEGDSKQEFANISKNDFVDSLKVVTKIFIADHQRLIKFAVVGVVGFIVQTVTFEILLSLNSPVLSLPFNATALAAEVAVVSNFIWSNFWTFGDRKLSLIQIPYKFLLFNLGSLGSIGAQWVTMRVGTGFFGSGFLPVHIFYMLGIGIGMISNYFVYSRVIWRIGRKNHVST